MTEEAKKLIEEFKKEQVEVLLSLDEAKIRAFVKKWNGTDMPKHPEAFWGAVHKSITGITSLPTEFRRKSKDWLEKRGWRSYDDGDL